MKNQNLTILTHRTNFSRALVTAANLMFVASNYIVHLIVARNVGNVELYGDYTVLILVMTLLHIGLSSGAPLVIATVSRLENREGVIKSLLSFQIIAAISLSFLFFRADLWMPSIVHNAHLSKVWPFLAVTFIPFGIYSFLSAWINAEGLYRQCAIAIFVFLFFRLFLTYFLVPKLGIDGVIFAFTVGCLFSLTYLLYALRSRIKVVLRAQRKPVVKQSLYDAMGFLAFGFATHMLVSLDVFILTNLRFDRYLIGEYTTFITLGKVPFYLLIAMMSFAWPELNARMEFANRSRFVVNLIRGSLLFSVVWNFFLLYSYIPLAEYFLTREVIFSTFHQSLYGCFISLLLVAYLIWQYLNTYQNRVSSALIVLAVIVLSASLAVVFSIKTIPVLLCLLIAILVMSIIVSFLKSNLRTYVFH